MELPVTIGTSSIYIWNCDGILNRLQNQNDIQNIRCFLKQYDPQILLLSETWLVGSSNNQSFISTDFKYNNDRDTFDSAFVPGGVFSNYNYVLSNNKDQIKLMNASHESEGRVIFVEFREFYLLHLYVPNNGQTSASNKRRKDWDNNLSLWLRDFLPKFQKAIVIAGDMNCAPTSDDLSDPTFFADRTNSTQSGPIERARWNEMIESGNLVDAYRMLFNFGSNVMSGPDRYLQGAFYTWRGKAAKDESSKVAKYEGYAMKLDHFLVQRTFMGRIVSCDILGSGETSTNSPSFMGSDHCPMRLIIRNNSYDKNK
ncbi:hypothetical protein ScalyP_jg3343 [Parmales sp. scaly parma]|nr:hypothetical protein ScalyP_jg3343 [Parmales sp. scaly parma]